MNLEKFKGISTEMAIIMSAIVDKMEIGQELKEMEVNTGDEKKDREELGKQLIVLIISKLYKAKEEVYELIALYKGITIEEAKTAEIIPIIKELFGVDGAVDFLS